MAEPNEGLVRFPGGEQHALAEFPAEWLSKRIGRFTEAELAEARADIAARRPRWLTHDRLDLFTPEERPKS